MSAPNGDGEPPLRFQFHYGKAADFREVPCHGVIGGITPRGDLWVAPYTERGPIPKLIEHAATQLENGTVQVDELQTPVFVDTKVGMIRTMEVGLHLDLVTAERFRDWLSARIDELRALKK